MKQDTTTISVQLLGKEYNIACPKSKESDLLIAARQLQDRLRSIRNAGRTIGTERVATIAALNLMDELLQTQAELRSVEAQSQEQLESLMQRVDSALEDI